MKRVKMILQILRVFLILPWVNWKDERYLKDLARWKNIYHIDERNWIALAVLLWNWKEYRNLFIYRNRRRPIYRRWIALIYHPMETLYLDAGEIGGGFFIHHGFSTMVAAKSFGENCWVNHQVSVGYNGPGKTPIIGNNVMITCGAKVLGDITVGDNAVIGANAVVIRDVEPGAVMGGVPARKLK